VRFFAASSTRVRQMNVFLAQRAPSPIVGLQTKVCQRRSRSRSLGNCPDVGMQAAISFLPARANNGMRVGPMVLGMKRCIGLISRGICIGTLFVVVVHSGKERALVECLPRVLELR